MNFAVSRNNIPSCSECERHSLFQLEAEPPIRYAGQVIQSPNLIQDGRAEGRGAEAAGADASRAVQVDQRVVGVKRVEVCQADVPPYCSMSE